MQVLRPGSPHSWVSRDQILQQFQRMRFTLFNGNACRWELYCVGILRNFAFNLRTNAKETKQVQLHRGSEGAGVWRRQQQVARQMPRCFTCCL